MKKVSRGPKSERREEMFCAPNRDYTSMFKVAKMIGGRHGQGACPVTGDSFHALHPPNTGHAHGRRRSPASDHDSGGHLEFADDDGEHDFDRPASLAVGPDRYDDHPVADVRQ